MSPLWPPPLSQGDAVAIAAPAGPVSRAALEEGARLIARHFDLMPFGGALAREGFLAGDDDHRCAGLQAALDGDARAVIAARGGYGTTRILDRLDLSRLAARPRWVAGCSDLTALLLRLWAELGLVSIHGPMAARLPVTDPRDAAALFSIMRGEPWTAPDGLIPLRDGSATGPMIGGNLTVLAHLCGTLPPGLAEGAVLFIEDVGEAPYRLDRCLVQLARAGILPRAAGIVVGEMTACPPGDDGVTARRVIGERLEGLGVPVALGYPAAHGERNAPFVHGAFVRLEVSGGGVSLGAA